MTRKAQFLARVMMVVCGLSMMSGCTWAATSCDRFEPKVYVDPQDHSMRDRQAVRNMKRWGRGN